MTRLNAARWALSAGVLVGCLILSIAARDVHASLAWLTALLFLATAVLAERHAARAEAEAAHLRACLTYARKERDDARAQLRRAHMRLAARGERWDDLRVNGGHHLDKEPTDA